MPCPVFRIILGTSAVVAAYSTHRVAKAIETRVDNEIAFLQQIKESIHEIEKSTIPPLTQALKKHNERKRWF